MKKRILVLLLILTFISANFIHVSAVVQTITFDWLELEVRQSPTNAPAEDYFGENEDSKNKVHNLRCNYSTWDSAQEYLWLISDWSNSKKAPAWLYLGEFDMATLDKIAFDYITDGTSDMTDNRVSLTKDKEGKQVLATAQITEATGALKDPLDAKMEIKDSTYSGAVYIYIEYTARMFVGNLVFTTKDDGSTPSPTPEPTATPEATPTKAPTERPSQTPVKTDSNTDTDTGEDDNNSPYVFIAIGAIVVVAAGVIVVIWRKKK